MKRTGIVALVGLLLSGVGTATVVHAVVFGTIPSGNDTELVTIDTATGAATNVGLIGFADVEGLSGRASDLTLFGATGQPFNVNAGQILTIHPTSSSAGTSLGSPYGLPIGDLALSPIKQCQSGTNVGIFSRGIHSRLYEGW